MLPTQAFPPSLQALSIGRALAASVARNPQKVALTHSGGQLRYNDLHPWLQTPSSDWALDASAWVLLRLLQSLMPKACAPALDENTPLSGVSPTLTQRELMLSVFNIAVCHPILSRDSVSALPLRVNDPQDDRTGEKSQNSTLSPMSAIAALAPLLLGGTLCLIKPGDLRGLSELITSGAVNQAWLDSSMESGLLAQNLPAPHVSFRGLICVGLPSPSLCQALSEWVGPKRWHALALDARAMPWARHRHGSTELEPYPGLGMSDVSRAS